MKTKTNSLFNKLFVASLLLATVLSLQAADVAGTWTWTTPGRNGGPDRTSTLTLTEDHGALSGKVSAPGRDGTPVDSPISNGKIEGDKVTFDLIRSFNGRSVTNSYAGSVSADKITGKISFSRNGEVQSHDWDAKRAAVK